MVHVQWIPSTQSGPENMFGLEQFPVLIDYLYRTTFQARNRSEYRAEGVRSIGLWLMYNHIMLENPQRGLMRACLARNQWMIVRQKFETQIKTPVVSLIKTWILFLSTGWFQERNLSVMYISRTACLTINITKQTIINQQKILHFLSKSNTALSELKVEWVG